MDALKLENPTTLAVATGFVVVLGLAVLGLQPSRPAGNNPFSSDTREAPRAYINDKAKRDSILKNGYSASKLEATGKNFDVIIIGSGIGGLTTAALLSRAGKKVLVLEQHDQCGGCCHSFHEKDFEFDTGIHYIGEMRNNTGFRFLMDQMTNGQLLWANVRDDFDTVVLVDDDGTYKTGVDNLDKALKSGKPLPSKQVSYMSSEEATIASLVAAFPEEESAIRKYFKTLVKVRKATLGFVGLKFMPQWLGNLLVATGLVHFMSDWFKYASISTTDMIKKITANPTLRAVLSYNFGDYGTIPKDAPFTMHAVLNNHFMKGVSFPIGGSSEIGLHILPTILKAGGAVFVRAEVEKIVLDESGRKAVGVQMKRDGNVVTAPLIVSAAGIYNTYNKLLAPQAQPKLAPTMKHVRHGMGGISVYVGLKGSAEELQIDGKHFWAMWTQAGQEDLDGITERYLNRPVEEATSGPIPLLFISFPSAKDPLWPTRCPGKSTCTIVTVGNFDWFSKWEDKRVMHRGADYDKFKKAFGDMIWKQTVALFPQLKDKVEYFDVGTPITNNYYLAASAGEMYGADHDMKRFTPEATVNVRCETPIQNLYMSGQDVFTCGFAGATFGGLFCASTILNRNLYVDLMDLKKKSPPCSVNTVTK